MMDLSRFNEEPPLNPQPDVPEREDEEKLPPTRPVYEARENITARFLPTISVWLAGERRSVPFCHRLGGDGKIVHHPTPEDPVVLTQEGREETWWVLAFAKTSEAAIAKARERKEVGL